MGKSSFIRRFCEGSYVADMETTIGVDFYLSEIDVNGKKIKVSCCFYQCEFFIAFCFILCWTGEDLGHSRFGKVHVNISSLLQVCAYERRERERERETEILHITALSTSRKADGVVFVFDVTKPRSFTNVETIWMNAVDAPERYTRDY